MKYTKHDLLIPYIKTNDSGKELKYSLRSIKNIQNFSGNLYNPESTKAKDYKTKTNNLKDGDIVSTQFYTSELDKLFPEACEFEAEYVV